MRSYKLHAMRNYVDWRCQACNTDMWLVDREIGTDWPLDFCTMECFRTIPLSNPIIDAFKKVVDSGRYHVDALEVADAMLDGAPSRVGAGIRSFQWRERRLAQLEEAA